MNRSNRIALYLAVSGTLACGVVGPSLFSAACAASLHLTQASAPASATTSVAPPAVTGAGGNPGVLPPNSNPYGASYAEWSERWWKWVLSIPAGSNPLLDTSGQFCDQGQSGSVWFLAGTVGGTATRSCTIPSGRAIFFPIVNTEIDAPCSFPECAANLTPEACAADPTACAACLVGTAKDILDGTTALQVQLDGIDLHNLFDYRAASGLFSFAADVSLQAFDSCITGTAQPFASDGYWIMLAPLRPGQHTLHFKGNEVFAGFPFETEVTYNLTVLPGGRGRGHVASVPDGVQQGSWGMVKEIFR